MVPVMLPLSSWASHGVGDGGEHHGDVLVLGGGVAGRGGGSGDGAHDGHVLGGEALSDLGGDGVVKARVLIDRCS